MPSEGFSAKFQSGPSFLQCWVPSSPPCVPSLESPLTCSSPAAPLPASPIPLCSLHSTPLTHVRFAEKWAQCIAKQESPREMLGITIATVRKLELRTGTVQLWSEVKADSEGHCPAKPARLGTCIFLTALHCCPGCSRASGHPLTLLLQAAG